MKRSSLNRRIGIRSTHIFLQTADEAWLAEQELREHAPFTHVFHPITDEARLAEQEYRDMLRSLAPHRCAKVRNLSDNSVIIGDKEQFLHIFAAGYSRVSCMT